jgi:hypothetical protein
VYFRNVATPPPWKNHWIQVTDVVDASFMLRAGSGYFIKVETNKVWQRVP